MLNIYDRSRRVRNTHLRNNGSFGSCLIYSIQGIGFFSEKARIAEHEMGATEMSHMSNMFIYQA